MDLGLVEWIRSVPTAVHLVTHGEIHLRNEHVGRALTMSDGRTYVPFRETLRQSSSDAGPNPSPVVLQPRFHLHCMGPDRQLLHAVFRRACIATTPFFVGLEGFRSKLWMVDPNTGDFAGLYEWEHVESAWAYAEGLARILRSVSVQGSVSYELVDGSTVDDYLRQWSH